MYKLIPQPAAPAKTGTEEEEEVRGAAGRMDAACAEDRNPGAASAHRADKRQMHAGGCARRSGGERHLSACKTD